MPAQESALRYQLRKTLFDLEAFTEAHPAHEFNVAELKHLKVEVQHMDLDQHSSILQVEASGDAKNLWFKYLRVPVLSSSASTGSLTAGHHQECRVILSLQIYDQFAGALHALNAELRWCAGVRTFQATEKICHG
ncbi:uncharacterized protein BDV17DRAFT_286544 [Aspergillus undulatus]|uniref:uncharacterized protein n=1 Tax=Aspergillus undulatus TaxID=1810928 RepID=UPI003CCDC64F